jgi:hypothetical protein
MILRRMGEWKYSSSQSIPRYYIQMSGQLHDPAALEPGKEPSVPLKRRPALKPLEVFEKRKVS